MRDEASLIRAAAEGDRRAFESLVALKREQVVRTAFQVTGELEDAKDVAQRVFLRLWGILDRFDPERRFDTWLYRITVNAAIDHLRSQAGRQATFPLPDDPSRLEAADGTRAPEEALDLGRLQAAFIDLAARLSPQQRAVFVLREIEGLAGPEVARILGIGDSTVRNHLMQARRALRRGLERDYPELVPPFAAGPRATGEERGDD